jgi:hypothetical protein
MEVEDFLPLAAAAENTVSATKMKILALIMVVAWSALCFL